MKFKRLFSEKVGFVLAIIWLVFGMSTYLFFHPYMISAIRHFAYWDVVGAFMLLSYLIYAFHSGFNLRIFRSASFRIRLVSLLPFWVFGLAYFYYRILQESIPADQDVIGFTQHFIGLSLVHFFYLSLISLSALGFGYRLLSSFGYRKVAQSHPFASMGLGIALIGSIIFIHMSIHPLSWMSLLFLGVVGIIIGYPGIIYFIRNAWLRPKIIKGQPLVLMILFAVSSILLCYSWIAQHKLMATGYDGITLYANLAHLIAKSGEFIAGNQAYHGSLLMGAAGKLFSNDAMMFLIGYWPAYLLVALVLNMTRPYLTITEQLSACAIWLAIPSVMFHMSNTEKVDLTLSYIVLSTICLFFSGLQSSKQGNRLLVMLPIGFMLGYAMGIKLTAFFAIIALVAYLFYSIGGRKVFQWGFLLIIGLFFLSGIYKFAGINQDNLVLRIIGLISFIVGGYELWRIRAAHSNSYKWIIVAIMWMVAGTILSYGPWLIKNVSEGGISFEALINGKSEEPVIQLTDERVENGKRSGSAAAGLLFLGNTRREEMGKFIGFDKGFYKYFSVLYKMSTNPKFKDRMFVDIGFYFLLFIPFLLFFPGDKRPRFMGILFFLFFLSVSNYIIWDSDLSGFNLTNNVFIDAHPTFLQSFFSFMPLALHGIFISVGTLFSYIPLLGASGLKSVNIILSILLFIGLFPIVTPYFRKLSKEEKAWTLIASVFLYLWYITGTGIPWYAFPVLPLVIILLIRYFHFTGSKWQSLHSLAIASLLFFMIPFRLSPTSIGKSPESHQIVLTGSLLYSTGKLADPQDILKGTKPIFAQAAQILNEDPESKIYCSGTLLRYFIHDNDKRLHLDGQYEEFYAISQSQSDVGDYFIEVLKKNGFKYILFNPSDIFYDQTPEQTYRKKFDAFMRVIESSNKVKLVLTDQKIQSSNGRSRSALFGGQVVKYGEVALLEIL